MGGILRSIDVARLVPSETADRYAQAQLPNDARHRLVLAKAMTILEQSERGARIARALEEGNIRLEIGPVFANMGGQYIAPFTGANVGASFKALVSDAPWPHLIKVAPSQAEDPRILAAMLAHEGAHYDLTLQNVKNIPIRAGAGLLGGVGFMLSLPTLGMLDMNGNVHRPGIGAIASMMQGSVLSTAMTHENYAYRIGDAVIEELGGNISDSFVYAPDGSERGAVDGGWRIARSYMRTATETVAGRTVPDPEPWKLLIGPVVGLGLGIALRHVAVKLLHVPPRFAGYAVLAPGAIAAAIAGYGLLSGGMLFQQSLAGRQHSHRLDLIERFSTPTPIYDAKTGQVEIVEMVADDKMDEVLAPPPAVPAMAAVTEAGEADLGPVPEGVQ